MVPFPTIQCSDSAYFWAGVFRLGQAVQNQVSSKEGKGIMQPHKKSF